MKRYLNKLSYICIAYTLCILCLIVLNGLSGRRTTVSGEESLVILLCIISVHIVSWLLSLIPFRSKSACSLTGFLAQYAAFCCILLIWLPLQGTGNLKIWFVKNSGIYIVVYAMLTIYYHKKRALEAEEINRLLSQYEMNCKKA